MSGGSIDDRVWNTPTSSVTWHERLQWAADAIEVFQPPHKGHEPWCWQGLRFIHSKGYSHYDVKSQNILYSGNGKDTVAKLAGL